MSGLAYSFWLSVMGRFFIVVLLEAAYGAVPACLWLPESALIATFLAAATLQSLLMSQVGLLE
jgi:hypothetical protein